MFEKVLFPTRFEEFSLPILKSICGLNGAGLQEVILLHVIDTNQLKEVNELGMMRQAAAKQLAPHLEYLRSRGIKAKSKIVGGRLIPEILRIAAEENVSLIVAGRQKRDLGEGPFVDSVTDRIIRKAKIPVLVVKYQFCIEMFRKILYATDWSVCAEQAKNYLCSLHKAGVTRVVAVHVIEDHFAECHYLDLNLQAALGKISEEKMKALRRELQTEGFFTKTFVLHGKPYQEISGMATQQSASLIVMGAQGQGADACIPWGSVSQRVVEYSQKPVLIVKQDMPESAIPTERNGTCSH